jgi:FAD:protein FMN transferase
VHGQDGRYEHLARIWKWLIGKMDLKYLKFFIGTLIFCFLVMVKGSFAQEPVKFHGETMGTTWSVAIVPPSDHSVSDLKPLLQQRLDQINQKMSTFDLTSEVSCFNRQQGTDWFPISAETAKVIALALDVSRLTDGAFDISVGPLVDLWGFGPAERKEAAPTDIQLEQVINSIGYKKIELRAMPLAVRKKVGSLRIDLSAIAKGYAVDELAKLLKIKGVDNFLVEVGGELQLSGNRSDGSPWRVAIERPLEGKREVHEVLPVTGTAIATSGNYRNFYIDDGQHYAHTIDPQLGRPVRHKLASATIFALSCARADALATAMMVLGEIKGRKVVESNHIMASFLVYEDRQLKRYRSSALQEFMSIKKP